MPQFNRQPYQIDPFFRRLFILVAIGVFLYILYLLKPIIIPFLSAFILAYAINPLVQKLQDKFHLRRWVAILLVYVSIGLGVGLILWWLLPLVFASGVLLGVGMAFAVLK